MNDLVENRPAWEAYARWRGTVRDVLLGDVDAVPLDKWEEFKAGYSYGYGQAVYDHTPVGPVYAFAKEEPK